jgi:hypothetical protein
MYRSKSKKQSKRLSKKGSMVKKQSKRLSKKGSKVKKQSKRQLSKQQSKKGSKKKQSKKGSKARKVQIGGGIQDIVKLNRNNIDKYIDKYIKYGDKKIPIKGRANEFLIIYQMERLKNSNDSFIYIKIYERQVVKNQLSGYGVTFPDEIIYMGQIIDEPVIPILEIE